MKLVYNKEARFLWAKGDLHTHFGILKEADIKKKKVAKTNTGVELHITDANFLDLTRKIKRGPQTLLHKDLAIISFYSGISNTSKVLDAGSGCGLLAISLARIAKSVTTCDINDAAIALTKHNIKLLGVKNVKVKKHNIYESIPEKKLDAITLDVPEPWHVFPHTENTLKLGGIIVTYLPTIIQAERTVNEAEKNNLFHQKTIEILEREWHIEGRKVRPKSQMMGHTAFLSFFRKL